MAYGNEPHTASTQAPVRQGDVLANKYRVDRVLGVGGMGVVVSATHLQLDQRVALKFMLPAAFANPEALGRFQREARAAVKLKSEHVARVLDTGTFDDGSPYIVMEYLEGTDLAGELERAGTLPLPVVAEYIVQACEAIAEAHGLGIVHRDLKPGNLFLTRRAEGSPLVKVLDFGISKASALTDSGGLSMTKTSSILGSPLYMSPEQMKSSRSVDARTDVWSLGVILYEMLGGRVPFMSETLGGLMAAVMTETFVPLEHVRPDLPREACILVNRCLEKDPARRVANVAEIARGLAPYCPPRMLPIVERVSALVSASPAPVTPGSPPQQVRTMMATVSQSPVAGAISGPTGPSPSWGSTGAPVQKGASFAALWVLGGVVVVGGVVALGLVVMQKRTHAAADTPASTVVAGAVSVPSAALPVATTLVAMPEPTVTASTTASVPTQTHATTTAITGRPPPRTVPSASAKPTPVATVAPTATATATQQKPGILDTSN